MTFHFCPRSACTSIIWDFLLAAFQLMITSTQIEKEILLFGSLAKTVVQ